jgi:hypothetical protein
MNMSPGNNSNSVQYANASNPTTLTSGGVQYANAPSKTTTEQYANAPPSSSDQ